MIPIAITVIKQYYQHKTLPKKHCQSADLRQGNLYIKIEYIKLCQGAKWN